MPHRFLNCLGLPVLVLGFILSAPDVVSGQLVVLTAKGIDRALATVEHARPHTRDRDARRASEFMESVRALRGIDRGANVGLYFELPEDLTRQSPQLVAYLPLGNRGELTQQHPRHGWEVRSLGGDAYEFVTPNAKRFVAREAYGHLFLATTSAPLPVTLRDPRTLAPPMGADDLVWLQIHLDRMTARQESDLLNLLNRETRDVLRRATGLDRIAMELAFVGLKDAILDWVHQHREIRFTLALDPREDALVLHNSVWPRPHTDAEAAIRRGRTAESRLQPLTQNAVLSLCVSPTAPAQQDTAVSKEEIDFDKQLRQLLAQGLDPKYGAMAARMLRRISALPDQPSDLALTLAAPAPGQPPAWLFVVRNRNMKHLEQILRDELQHLPPDATERVGVDFAEHKGTRIHRFGDLPNMPVMFLGVNDDTLFVSPDPRGVDVIRRAAESLSEAKSAAVKPLQFHYLPIEHLLQNELQALSDLRQKPPGERDPYAFFLASRSIERIRQLWPDPRKPGISALAEGGDALHLELRIHVPLLALMKVYGE